MNIVGVIREATSAVANKDALIDGEERITYAELLAAVDEVAAALRSRGVGSLHRVAFLCEDGIDYVIGSLAILSLSAVVVPVSPSLMEHEVDEVMDRIDTHFLLADRSVCKGRRGDLLESAHLREKSFCVERRVARDDIPAEYKAMNPAFVRFSSGTTGASKGVILSHNTIVERTDGADKGLHVTSGDTVLWLLSMTFHFVVSILLFLRRGATIVICERSFPESFLDGVRNHRGTFIYGSPFHFHVLATSASVERAALSGIRLAISTAMKLPQETARAFAGKFGFGLAEAYGIIEVGLPFIHLAGDGGKRGSVGKALPDYEARILNPDKDGVGEVLITGKGLFDAYFSPWQSRGQALDAGWFRTGDVGRIDDDGYLFIVGRRKTLINFAGMKVFPYEVEEVINQFPGIRESLVHGVPHPQYGELPCAKVVLQRGSAAPNVNELRRFCFQRLAPYKVPKQFEFVDSLEKTASGKLRRT